MKKLQKTKKELLKILKQHRIASVTVDYDGSGDDGQINDVKGFAVCDTATVKKKLGADHELIPTSLDQNISWRSVKGVWKNGDWDEVEKIQDIPLEEAIRDFCYDILQECGYDWINNDGGYGTIKIDTETGVVHLDHHQRVMSEEHHEQEF